MVGGCQEGGGGGGVQGICEGDGCPLGGGRAGRVGASGSGVKGRRRGYLKGEQGLGLCGKSGGGGGGEVGQGGGIGGEGRQV